MLCDLFAIETLRLLREAVIQPFVGLIATLIIVIILPFDNAVIAQGHVLRNETAGFAVSIESGDTGVEAALELTPGLVTFRA